jgi:hypothetical protein
MSISTKSSTAIEINCPPEYIIIAVAVIISSGIS